MVAWGVLPPSFGASFRSWISATISLAFMARLASRSSSAAASSPDMPSLAGFALASFSTFSPRLAFAAFSFALMDLWSFITLVPMSIGFCALGAVFLVVFLLIVLGVVATPVAGLTVGN